MEDSLPLDQSSNDIDDPDVIMVATDRSFVANGNGGGSEYVLYSVDDDIVPRQYRRMQEKLGAQGGPYNYYYYYYNLALSGWSEAVRNTSGMLLTYVIPFLFVVFFVGAMLTVIPLRRMYINVLSTSFYVFVSLLVDAGVLLVQCGSEWLRATTAVDIRTTITGSSAVLCKIYPFVISLALQLSSWLTVVMAAETAWVYQRPQRLTSVCRLQRARRVLGGLLIALGLSNVHLLWTYTIHYPPRSGTGSSLADPPVCIDRLADPRKIPASSADSTPSWDVDIARLFASGFRFMVSQLIPYFAVFSCAVMLITKRWRRRDQLRQVDNTWKACNVDASAGRQLHTAFAVLCVLHSVILLPRLAFDSFQFVTDPRITGHRSVSYRPGSVLAKTVVYLLHYAFLAARPLVLLAASSAVRRQCADETCIQSPLCCCLCLNRKSNNRRSPSSLSADGSIVGVGGASGDTSGDHVTVAGEPLLQKSSTTIVENNHHGGHHVTFNDIAKTDDMIAMATHMTSLPLPPAPPPPPQSSAAIVLENGAPCIKIFSMTSV